jgi:hypothetical protein
MASERCVFFRRKTSKHPAELSWSRSGGVLVKSSRDRICGIFVFETSGKFTVARCCRVSLGILSSKLNAPVKLHLADGSACKSERAFHHRAHLYAHCDQFRLRDFASPALRAFCSAEGCVPEPRRRFLEDSVRKRQASRKWLNTRL